MQPQIDVIILSNAFTNELLQTTYNCVKSCDMSEEKGLLNIMVSEDNLSILHQQNIEGIYPTSQVYHINCIQPFNYNAYMNVLSQYGSAPYIAFCNNDLIFYPNWATQILNYMKENNYVSCSPALSYDMPKKEIKNASWYRGGSVAGWCLVIKRDFFEEVLQGFNTQYNFWASDDIYAKQLKNSYENNHICYTSIVEHLEGVTTKILKYLDPDLIEELTVKQTSNFVREHGQF